ATSPAPAPPRKVFLFLDWFHIQKGELQARLDLDRVPEEGRKMLDMYEREFGKYFPRGTHGFEPVDVPFGIRVVPEVAKQPEPWLKPDEPWEDLFSYLSVMHDEGRYRCWYFIGTTLKKITLTFDQGRGMEVDGAALAYAESTDGWNWTKPKRGRTGNVETNIVGQYGNTGIVFRDDHGPPEERYKLWHFDELPKETLPPNATSHQRYGLFGVVSPDGYQWTKRPKPLVPYFADTDNVVAWDPLLGK